MDKAGLNSTRLRARHARKRQRTADNPRLTGREVLQRLRSGETVPAHVERMVRDSVRMSASVQARLCEKMYSRTRNPLFAWEAYHLHRKTLCEPVPAWVLDYLDQLGINLFALRDKRKTAKALAQLLTGMKGVGRGGFGQIFEKYKNVSRDAGLASEVKGLIDAGQAAFRAQRRVADSTRAPKGGPLSESVVRRAYEKYREFLEDPL